MKKIQYKGYVFVDNGDIYKNNKKISIFYDSKGYARFNFNGKKKYVHNLICKLFHGNKKSANQQCGHLDGNKHNNKANNLKWVTRKENCYHKKIHGTNNDGIRNGKSKLTEKQVKQIYKDYWLYGLQNKRDLGKKYGVTGMQIANIVNKKNWKRLLDEY